jgi:ankyrin repeat protein
LRQWPKDQYQEILRTGSTFTTTIHVLVSAVQKLASVIKIPDGLKLYRGLGGVNNLPESFNTPQKNGGKGFTEWGFMSTTSDKQVAVGYSAGGGQNQAYLPMVLELSVSAVDRGARIEEYSQYPHEVEYLFVPCSFIAPDGGERMEVTPYGVVRVIRVRVNSNFRAHTLEQVLASKKLTHIAAFRFTIQELQLDLSRTCQKHGTLRLKNDFYKTFNGKIFTPEGLVQSILEQCKRRLKVHEDIKEEMFAKDETFRRLVTEMLNVKTMAKSKLKLWLEDPSQCIMNLESVSLRDAHRKLVGFLGKRMLSQNKDASRETAVEICRLKGLIDKSVEEVDDLEQGETKLVSASADGVSATDLELLLECGGCNQQRHEAMMKAAAFGHVHCLKVLINAGVDIHCSNADGVTPLYVAALNGHAEAAEILLENNANIDAADNSGASPLYRAARLGHSGTVRKLLEYKANVNAADHDGVHALCVAAQNGHIEVVTMLLERSADVNAARHDGITSLYIASLNGHAKTVKILLDCKAHVDTICRNGVTPLYRASQNRHAEAVKILLEHKADVNAASDDGANALYMAAQEGQAQTVRILLEHNANVNAACNDSVTPLYRAAANGHVETVSILLEHKADVHTACEYGITPVYRAATNGHTEAVKILLEHKADVNAARDDGASALYMAAQNGHAQTVKVLLEYKADASAICDYDVPPLFRAAANGHTETVKILLEHKADVNAARDDGASALYMASQEGHIDVVRMLLLHNADVNTADEYSVTPVYKAAENGHAAILETLLEHNGDVNSQDLDGITLMYTAAQNGHAQTVKILLAHNADLNHEGNNGAAYLHAAAQNGHTETVKILLEHKADVNAARDDGANALYMAAQEGHADVLRMLLLHHADPNCKASCGWSPLRQAVLSGKKSCTQLLLEYGADVMLGDQSGDSVLMLAVCMEDWEGADSLLSLGGYELLTARNVLGWSCLDIVSSGESALAWMESAKAKYGVCESDQSHGDSQSASSVELFRGEKWSVSAKVEAQCSIVLFREFATVRASQARCPAGSAAYYELEVIKPGLCTQWGFCTDGFRRKHAHTHQGVGDDKFSWGVSGDRLLRFHCGRADTFEGRTWQEGDVIGIACDLRTLSESAQSDTSSGGSIWVSLNGDFSTPYGLIFDLPRGLSGLFAAFTSQSGVVRCNLGKYAFKHAAPGEGFEAMWSFQEKVSLRN